MAKTTSRLRSWRAKTMRSWRGRIEQPVQGRPADSATGGWRKPVQQRGSDGRMGAGRPAADVIGSTATACGRAERWRDAKRQGGSEALRADPLGGRLGHADRKEVTRAARSPYHPRRTDHQGALTPHDEAAKHASAYRAWGSTL